MCGYCWDLDDYEARHGHKCDDDCAGTCESCEIEICTEEGPRCEDCTADQEGQLI